MSTNNMINVRTKGDLEKIITTKGGGTIIFEGLNKKINRIIVGFDRKTKEYFSIGDKDSLSTSKIQFLKYILQKMEKMGFQSDKDFEASESLFNSIGLSGGLYFCVKCEKQTDEVDWEGLCTSCSE